MKSESILAFVVLVYCSGCGTLGSHMVPGECGVYAGVQADSRWISNSDDFQSPYTRPFFILGSIIDFPLSAVFDTLLFPLDYTNGGPSPPG